MKSYALAAGGFHSLADSSANDAEGIDTIMNLPCLAPQPF